MTMTFGEPFIAAVSRLIDEVGHKHAARGYYDGSLLPFLGVLGGSLFFEGQRWLLLGLFLAFILLPFFTHFCLSLLKRLNDV